MREETRYRDVGAASFRTTCWTSILSASVATSREGQEAFARLYQEYWSPIYRFIRRKGWPPEQAEEISQEFFLSLLHKERLSSLKREGGKFRSFLLSALQNFLFNIVDYNRAVKRGGGARPLSLQSIEAELAGESSSYSPELLFDREWALVILNRGMKRLEEECRRSGKEMQFKKLKPYLQRDEGFTTYRDLAADLGVSPGAIKVAVHRFRQRYGQLLREEIAQTVASPEEVKAELRHLIQVVGK